MSRLRGDASFRSRWLAAMGRAFPESTSSARSAEMGDAFGLNADSNLARESASLLWAASVAWRRHLRTATGLRQAAAAGSLLWFGVLFTVGPVRRLRMTVGGSAPDYWSATEPTLHVCSVAALALAIAMTVAARRRSSTVLAFSAVFVGIVLAALANRAGGFQFPQSLPYELRWLGLPIALALILRPPWPWRWPALAALTPMAVVLLEPLDQHQPWPSRNYGYGLYTAVQEAPRQGGTSNWIDGLVLLALIVVVATPFVVPAVGALLATPILGLAVATSIRSGRTNAVGPVILLICYFGLVAIWNYRRPRLGVSIDRSGGRGHRLEVSIEWPSTDRDQTIDVL